MISQGQHKGIKNGLYAVILALLFWPLIQMWTGWIELEPLKGAIKKVEQPEISLEDWNSASYQQSFNKYLKHNIGFRSTFIRTYNQMYFSFFDLAKANGVVIGPENYLYERNYIKAYYGTDYIGRDKIKAKINKLLAISDTLKKRNIDLMVVLAPGKGSHYPQFIPERYREDSIGTTNYEVYAEELAATNLHVLDFHRWFEIMKDTSRYPLFPRTGIHWSKYGEYLAADSMVKYIENIRQVDLPSLRYKGIELSDEMRSTDDDIEKAMNLLFDVPDLTMAYPIFSAYQDTMKSPVKVMTMADSYYWGMFNWGLSKKTFGGGEFWYYSKQIHPKTGDEPALVEEQFIPLAIAKNDVVILMSTDANLYKFGFGFIDQAYRDFFEPESEAAFQGKVNYYIKAIKGTPNWLKDVQAKADKKGITLEEMIQLDAEYMAKTQ